MRAPSETAAFVAYFQIYVNRPDTAIALDK